MDAEERGFGEDRYRHSKLTGEIIGAFYDVYNELGYGFLEEVYEGAMAVALTQRGIVVKTQEPIPVWFRGHKVGDYRADLLVEKYVIVDLKAAKGIDPAHEAQLLNYLRATDIEVGLVLNFGPKPQIKRAAFDNERKGRR